MENFDFIILGAGSAGCVLANRLTANPDTKVLLLEAGGKDTNPWIHIPGGYFKTMHNPDTDWCFNTEKEPNCDNRQMVYPRGKTLGGSSSINGMLYIRGQSNDYNYWRQLGNVGWSWDDVLPYFKKSEDKNSFEGECFVFDDRVTVDKDLNPGGFFQCFACRRPLSKDDLSKPEYMEGISCHNCFFEKSESDRTRYAERQKQFDMKKS